MSHKHSLVFAASLLALGLAGCASAPSTAAAPTPVDLRSMMTPAQFKAAGLDKLAPDEIKALDGWLAGHVSVAAHEQAAPTDTNNKEFGLAPKPKPQPKSVDSRIAGHFDGWDGDTVFKLQNGQVWQQAGFGNFVHHADNPEVHIWKGWFGYLMRIKGYNATVAVRRIK